MNYLSDIKIVDNVFVKMMVVSNIGGKIEGHAHTFDHITLLARGRVVMRANGIEQEHIAPKLIVTPKGVTHEFEALDIPSVLCCIHAIRDGETLDDIAAQTISAEEADSLMQQYPLTA
jgi:quercetin dioxygenase-like cupin family protein